MPNIEQPSARATDISRLIHKYTNILGISYNMLSKIFLDKGKKITDNGIAKWAQGKNNSICLDNVEILAEIFYLVGNARQEFFETTVKGWNTAAPLLVKKVLIIHEKSKDDEAFYSEVEKNFKALGYETAHCYFSTVGDMTREIPFYNFAIFLISPLTAVNCRENAKYIAPIVDNQIVSVMLSCKLRSDQVANVKQAFSNTELLQWKQKGEETPNEVKSMKRLLDALIKKEMIQQPVYPQRDNIAHPIGVAIVEPLIRISFSRRVSIENLLHYFTESCCPAPLVLLSQFETKSIRLLLINVAKTRYQNTHDIVLPEYTDEISFYRSLGLQFNLFDVNSSGQFQQHLDNQLRHAQQPHFCIISRFENIRDEGVRKQFAGILRSVSERLACQLHFVLLGGEKLQRLTMPTDVSSMLNNARPEYWSEWRCDELDLLYTHLPELSITQELFRISGGHPRLLESCLLWYKTNTDLTELTTYLSDSPFLCHKFVQFAGNENERELLTRLINNPILKPAPLSPVWMYANTPLNTLLKKLYWENLITQTKEGLCWRCEAIQLAGKKVLENY